MKGAFETALVMMFGMMFMVMGMDYLKVVVMNNQARLLAENSLAILEHQNRYDASVQVLLDQNKDYCTSCNLMIEPHPDYVGRYRVIVNYPIELNHINYHTMAKLELLSRPLS